jgi:diguanylate cyclase (GGDEF)-like protein
MFLEYLPIPLVEFKRLTVVFRHGAACLFLPGYLALLERKSGIFSRIFCASQLICIIALLIPRDMMTLKAFYTITYLSVIPLPLYLTWIIFRHSLTRVDHLVLLVGAFTASVLSLVDSFIPIFDPSAIYLSQYGFLILILSATGFVVLDILHHYRLLLLERIRAEQYREERLHDPLTGVFNRSIMDLLIDNLPDSFSVIIADLNNFKAINDTYGHPIGDIVLKDTAHLMKRIFRRNDMIIRTGGDEFLIVLPDCPEEKAEELIRQLHEAIARSPVPLPDNKNFSYSISTGCAYTSKDELKNNATLIELVARADKAMYQQKPALVK